MSSPPVNRTVLARAQRGDRQATSRLLESCTPWVQARVRSKLPKGARADEDDIVQSVLMQIICGVAGLESSKRAPFFAWLGVVVDRQVMRAVKNRVSDAKRISVKSDSALKVDDRTGSKEFARQELWSNVTAAAEELTPDQYEAVRLRYFDNLSAEEASKRMSRSQAAIRLLCRRALATLRRRLARPAPQRRPADGR